MLEVKMIIGINLRRPSMGTTTMVIWLINLSLLPTVLNANRRNEGGGPQERAEAMERLSKVFRLDKVPVLRHHRSPPQYMVDLYNNVADNDGITKNRSPYGSDVVRGFPDRGMNEKLFIYSGRSRISRRGRQLRMGGTNSQRVCVLKFFVYLL